MKRPPSERLRHTALTPTGATSSAPRTLTDRERLAVLLQGGSLLSHLRLAGCRLSTGWQGARVDRRCRLISVSARPGRPHRWAQRQLADLACRLFDGVDGEITGRGHARRLARELVGDWRQRLLPVPPDELVRAILEAAPFLWQRPFGAARAALAAEHRGRGGPRLWVAGPGAFRRRVSAGCGGLGDLRRRLASDRARTCWDGPARPRDAIGRARQLMAEGRFETACGLIARRREPSAQVLALSCRARLGRLEGARRRLARIDAGALEVRDLVEVAETAVWVHGCLGRPAGAEPWLRRALAATGPARQRALLAAAARAWDAADLDQMDRYLDRARRESSKAPDWRWRQLTGLSALARRDAAAACRQFGRALAEGRRGIAPFDAAALWSDLGVARVEAGDLRGAERALTHSVRLHQRSEGARRTTLALCNLAAVRMRRGRLEGVHDVLARSERANRAAGNLRALAYDRALLARYELARGRPRRAVARATAALGELGDGDPADELRVVAARAHGWLGEASDAAERLAELEGGLRGRLESEEIPALLALAGDRAAAARAVRNSATEELWSAVLSGAEPTARAWRGLDDLGSYRAARLTADLELVRPGVVPDRPLRWALEVLERVGNRWLADGLESSLAGGWGGLERYLRRGRRDSGAVARLFRDAGYGDVSLVWQRHDRERTIVPGRGGDERLVAPVGDGELRLRTDRLDARVRALFGVALRDWRPPVAPRRRGSHGIVGRSPALLSALSRAERLARGVLPVLILGETGTGKELLARLVHRRSPRREAPLMALNSAALSEHLVLSDLFGHARGAFTGAERDRPGIFEAARGGTVLLDEIGDLPPAAQGLLLRVLQEGEVRRLGENRTRKVDVRVIAATHRRLERRVADGRFRADLLYRLAVGRVELPPLRDRGGDLELLARHFLERSAGGERLILTPEALDRLRAHDFPGNVRELANCLAAAAALAGDGIVRADDLGLVAPRGRQPGGYHQRVLELRRRLVREALHAAGGNRAAAARRLGVSRQALSYLVRTLGLE